MTMNKKSSRKITVRNEVYKYVISPSSKGLLVFTAEHEEDKGQKLRVYIESEINEFWVDFPYVTDLNLKVIKQSEVSMIIAEAIAQGWTPRSKGQIMTFNLTGSSLIKKQSNDLK